MKGSVKKADANTILGKRRDRAKGRKFLKQRKARLERRHNNADPERAPSYGRYRGWES